MIEGDGSIWTNQRLKILMGNFLTDGKRMKGERSAYNYEHWKFLLNAPFPVSNRCCNVMKKSPAHKYTKDTGLQPIIATMASESKIRTQKWLQQGCNLFEGNTKSSKPMSFWTEQDVLLYIKLNNLQIPSVYGDIVSDRSVTPEDINAGIFDDRPVLNTTKLTRTGCMFCLYGIHLEKSPNRLELMKESHPKQYEYIMKPEESGGLGYKEKIDWINANSKHDIKY